jgi:hypothetical protein
MCDGHYRKKQMRPFFIRFSEKRVIFYSAVLPTNLVPSMILEDKDCGLKANIND